MKMSTINNVNQGFYGESYKQQQAFDKCFGAVANAQYVIIDDYLAFTRDLSRSAAFHFAKEVDVRLHGKYQATFNQNSTKNFIRLRNYLRIFNPGLKMCRVSKEMRNRKFESQVLDSQLRAFTSNVSSFFSLPTTVTRVANEAITTLRQAQNTMGGIDNIMSIVTETVAKISSVAESIYANAGKIIAWALKILSFLQLVTQPHNQTVINLASIVTLILPAESGEYLIGILPLAIKGIIDHIQRPRFQTESLDGSDDGCTIVEAFFNMVRDMFAITFTGTRGGVFKNMKLNQDKVRYFVNGIGSVKTIYHYFTEVFRFVLNYIRTTYDDTVGCTGTLDQKHIQSVIDKFFQYKTTGKFELARKENVWAKNLQTLHDEMLEISNAILQRLITDEKFALKSLLPHLRTLLVEVKDALLTVPTHIKNNEEVSRNKPYWLYIFGEPRIGKSSFFQPLIVSELVARLKLTESYQHVANYTYFRRTGSEYWDGYTDQLVTWYNDVFQLNSQATEVVATIAELTDIIDDNPCLLNMAECERKDKVYFTSKIVVSNGQNDLPGQQFLSNNCWSNGQHILARRNCVVEFILNKEYAAAKGINKEKLRAAMMNPNVPKVSSNGIDLIPQDLYIIKFRHEITGYVRATTDIISAINIIVDDMIQYMNHQNDFKQNLFKFFESRYKERDDDGNVKPLSTPNPYVVRGPALDPNHMANVRFDTKISPEAIQKRRERIEEYNRENIPHAGIVYEKRFQSQMFGGFFNRTSEQALSAEAKPCEEGDCRCYQVAKDFYISLGTYSEEEIELFCEPYKMAHPECMKGNNLAHEMYSNLMASVHRSQAGSLQARTMQYAYKFFDSTFYRTVSNCVSSAFNAFVEFMKGDEAPFIMFVVSFLVVQYSIVLYDMVFSSKKSKVERPTEPKQCSAETSENTPNFQKPRIRRVNAETSENTPTYQKAKIRRVNAQTSENTPTYKKASIKRAPTIAQAYDDQNLMIENVLRTHFCRLSLFVVQDEKRTPLSQVATAVAIGGNVFMTQRHSYLRFQQLFQSEIGKKGAIRYELHTCTRSTITFDSKSIDWYFPDEELDVAFFQIKRGTAFKTISHFFLREGDSVNLTGSYLYGIRTPLINGMQVPETTILPVSQTYMEDVEYDTGESINVFDNTVLKNIAFTGIANYVYQNNHTLKGDCGMLLISSDSKLNTRRILGMHVAGSPTTHEGVAVPLFAEDIEDAIAHFNRRERMIVAEQCDMLTYGAPVGKVADLIRDAGQVPIGSLEPVVVDGTTIQPRIMLPRISNIRPSVASDLMEQKYGPSLVKPAHLKPFTNAEGETIKPLHVALSKYETHPAFIPEDRFEAIKQHIVDSYNSCKTYPIKNRKILDDCEAINGYGNMKQIDMSTSSGYPYCKRSNNGKNHWFERTILENGASVFEMKEYLAREVQDRIGKAKQGIIKETYFIDTLKDETRPIKKVEEGKTRIFQIGPLDLTIAMRKYFGAFIDFTHGAYLSNEMAIGINPNSVEWGIKGKRLKLRGRTGWDGDFTNYDASIWCQIIDMIADIISAWYNDGPENALIRKVLLKTLSHSLHILDDIVFLLFGGNPSGNVLTTIINGLAFQIMIRLYYLERISNSLSNFEKDLSVWNYGDDNMVLFSKGLKHTMEDARKFFAKYGMTYTPADKTQIRDVMIDFDDMTFLKRKWVTVDGEIMAPIEMDVITEIPRWSESDPTNMTDQLQRYNAALLEMSNYGRTKFNEMRSEFIRQFQILNERGYHIPAKRLFTYERCYEIKRDTSLNINELDDENDTAFLSHALMLGESY